MERKIMPRIYVATFNRASTVVNSTDKDISIIPDEFKNGGKLRRM
jgi:hypothetical protein